MNLSHWTLLGSLLAAGSVGAAKAEPVALPSFAEMKKQNARFAPVELKADWKSLAEPERRALARMIQAAQVMNVLFMRQVWAGNETLLLQLLKDTSPLGKERLWAFFLNNGPWWRLDHHTPFIPGVPAKPPQANFYPAGATKAEVEAWLKGLPEAQRELAGGFYTTVRRAPDGKLQAVPYSVEYQGELAEASRLLREAAAFTTQPTLKRFLTQRAEAFVTNDYVASEVAWMEMDASIDPTIGPYEVYEDEWFNAKAAFEAYVTLTDVAESQKLAGFSKELQELEDHLPIEPALRNPKLGALAPIRVVNSLFSAGEGNSSIQVAAFNLPNDERITREKGAKRVMLKNVQEAKFERILLPISKIALAAADRQDVDFDAFFTHILMHELMHGLGPHNIKVGGRQSTVRQELQSSSSAIEEAKADISGLWALQYLIDKGVVAASMQRTLYTTYLASMFRSLRFGMGEAHGKGVALQLNSLLDAGAVRVNANGTFSVVPEKIKGAVANLTRELMSLQAAGDRAKAEALLARLGVVRPETQKVLDQLATIPVDIRPRYRAADELLRQYGGPVAADGAR